MVRMVITTHTIKLDGHQGSRVLTIPGTNSNSCFLSGYLSNRPVCILLDNGADVSVIRHDVW